MRISPNFILREVAGSYVLIPFGEAARNLSGLIALNQSGKFLYDRLQNDCTQEKLIEEMLDAYDTDYSTAAADIADFIQMLRKNKMLIED